jgi:hypothetical protein
MTSGVRVDLTHVARGCCFVGSLHCGQRTSTKCGRVWATGVPFERSSLAEAVNGLSAAQRPTIATALVGDRCMRKGQYSMADG